MAIRCLNFIKSLSNKNTYSIIMVRQNFMSSVKIPQQIQNIQAKSSVEYKTENNLTYLEDPDSFGTLSNKSVPIEDIEQDDGDIQEEEFLKKHPLKSQQLTIKQYADIIKKFLKHKRLKEAIDILEVRMIKEDQVKPDNYLYNILIGACAEFGYTKKAFKLFNDMKKRALKPTGDTYTCLFEACINSPYKENGLKYATHLRNLMIEKGIEPNVTNYNVMIKAFGRCGDLPMAFKIVDEMISKKIKIRVHTLNHLLHACISDKKSGLRHALVVWRKMLKLREKPNIYSFNLMLKCVKECNLGTKDDIQELINIIEENIVSLNSNMKKPLQLKSNDNFKQKNNIYLPTVESDTKTFPYIIEDKDKYDFETALIPVADNSSNEVTSQVDANVTLSFIDNNNLPSTSKQMVPNLLSRTLNLNQVCGLQEIHTVQDKFAIVGGQDDFLQQMNEYSVKPDIKTFTQMLAVIDDSTDAENKLLDTIKSMNIRKDIDFYNTLIKKRCLRSDYNSAFEVKDMIENENKEIKKHPFNKKYKLKFNIMTYGTLALACNTKELAVKLLDEMKEKQLRVNIQILGTLMRHGTAHLQFGYILYVMDVVRKEHVKVNSIFLKHLESFNEKCEKIIRQYNEEQKESNLILAYNRYYNIYKKWLTEVNVEEAVKQEDPWKQFKENYPKPLQKEGIEIIEPKKFYKRSRKFVQYVPKI